MSAYTITQKLHHERRSELQECGGTIHFPHGLKWSHLSLGVSDVSLAKPNPPMSRMAVSNFSRLSDPRPARIQH